MALGKPECATWTAASLSDAPRLCSCSDSSRYFPYARGCGGDVFLGYEGCEAAGAVLPL